MPHFGDYQTEIYFKGLRGVLPSLPADFKLLEQRAQAAMPPSVLSYVQGGCGDEFTQSQNANAFHHWGLVPRMLVDCSTRDLTVDLFGLKLPLRFFSARSVFLASVLRMATATSPSHVHQPQPAYP
jgi:lactate 2-monooxygenase